MLKCLGLLRRPEGARLAFDCCVGRTWKALIFFPSSMMASMIIRPVDVTTRLDSDSFGVRLTRQMAFVTILGFVKMPESAGPRVPTNMSAPISEPETFAIRSEAVRKLPSATANWVPCASDVPSERRRMGVRPTVIGAPDESMWSVAAFVMADAGVTALTSSGWLPVKL